MHSLPFTAQQIVELKTFIAFCAATPGVIHHPDLTFFREYLRSLGARLPPKPANDDGDAATSSEKPKPKTKPQEQASPSTKPEESESGESEVELDTTGVIEPDTDEPQSMGDPDRVVSEEEVDKSDEKKMEAMSAYGEGDFEKSVTLYTEAIMLNPGSALLHAKRGQCYLKMNRPNACIRDCNKALELNPDSAAAYKFRGRANRLLGRWEEAAEDLRTACKIDYDEQADEWLREVTPNARKLVEHRRKYERRREEKELKERKERFQRAQEAREKAAKQQQEQQQDEEMHGDPRGGGGMPDFTKLFSDPEIMQALEDPEVAAAFQDISSNPINIVKYQSNPKVKAVINKLVTKFGGAEGMGGGFPGGGFPDMGAQPPSSSPSGDDIGLD